jgi:hypothetical protein
MKGYSAMKTPRFASLTLTVLCVYALAAHDVPGLPHGTGSGNMTIGGDRAAACSPATSSNELDLNNVRARIETGGNMWQDRTGSGGPAYEVPKTPKETSIHSAPNALYAGALWMGGKSPDNQLKLAAVTFRQRGNDFWPGPLTAFDTITHTGDASVDGSVCSAYDQTWKTKRLDAEMQEAYYQCLADPQCDVNVDFPGYVIPSYFYQWPAHGDVSLGQDYNLAPYHDFNGDNMYRPDDGDYPDYDLQQAIDCKAKRREDKVPLFGDQNIWWVFNDKGNTHSESGGQPIGMEIRAQAFEFSTNDEVNNMSFYNYVLINQGSQTLEQTYFGQWVDPDLGGGQDDYVGCDVQRGLGFCYNGDAVDEDFQGAHGYGGPNPPPPAVGVDFFEGPYQDYDDMDNPLTQNCQDARDSAGITYAGIGIGYGDGVKDNERYGMRAFVYHNNDATVRGDPTTAIQFYSYMKGIWRDNTPMTYGGTGYSSSSSAQLSSYMFPGDSDPLGWGTECLAQPIWSEETENNNPFDRRFIQSAGPFTLDPGAYNNITVGVVWARATSGNVQSSVNLMRKADDKAQSLFDNCFRILNGPDAPNLAIQELDRELILTITNPPASNNFNEQYAETDPSIPQTDSAGIPYTVYQRQYHFQGYEIYQVKDVQVGPDELKDPDKARLVAQVDIKDNVTQLVNWIQDADINLPVPTEEVNGGDSGIVHSFRILEDKFGTTDPHLKNFQTYYFMAIAYGYNQYQAFDPVQLNGQPYPYLAGRKSPTGAIRAYAGIPHKPSVENGGTVQNAQYGDGFKITRIEGQGNGGQAIALESSTLNAIVASDEGRVDELHYQKGLGPVNIKVVDPLNVPAGQFELWITDTTSLPLPASLPTYTRLQDAIWMLVRITDDPSESDTVRSSRTIELANEQLIPQWGISVDITQTIYRSFPGTADNFTNLLGSTKEISGPDWYAGIPDIEGEFMQNWVRSGAAKDSTLDFPDVLNVDPEQQYEHVLGGTWAPWPVVGDAALQPCSPDLKTSRDKMVIKELSSIQVVITPDKSKWTRCVVVEESDEPSATTPSNVAKLHMRPVPSVDKNGIPHGSEGCNEAEATLTDAEGMGWFPGYAVDLETGERLNMLFGENSFLGGSIGRDMLWNPSDQLYDEFNGQPIFGGCHWIYVCVNQRRTVQQTLSVNRMPQYDEGAFARSEIGNTQGLDYVYRSVGWVGSGLMTPGTHMNSPQQGLVPSEVRLRIDIDKPYFIYADPYSGYSPAITPERNGGLPLYTFNTGDGATVVNATDVGKSALDLIGVVPNPYYAYSGYETTRLDNRVKFINLPKTCTISIFTVSGTLVRKYKKDNELTYLDWDLNNSYNVPIAGGTYICHIEAPGLGERVIKWFGVIRPIDLQNF